MPTSCDGCGACCTEQAGLPVSWYLVMEPDTPLPPGMREGLVALREEWLRDGFPPDGSPCVWLDGTRCAHYEHRPAICREAVAVGDENCLAWRRAKL
jgi:Fe-S-cluster containining protein